MTRGASMTVENSFNKGLLTEFTAMNFPESAVTDADNVVFGELGDVQRRLGIDFEADHTMLDSSDLGDWIGAFTEYLWSSVSNEGTRSFVVQQIGTTLRFFELDESGNISSNIKPFYVDLVSHKSSSSVSNESVGKTPVQYSDGLGYLVITHPLCEPLYISYDADEDDIEVHEIEIEVRDLQGLPENLDIDERPSSLSNTHKYNLYNQGWYFDAMNTNDQVRNVITEWRDKDSSSYPSNADIWWLFKNAQERFDPNRKDNFTLGNTPAPKGHYIYSAFDINRSAETGISGLTRTTSGVSRPSCCAFFAGRFWFAGINTEGYSTALYFSQSIERDDQIGKCYQVNDPTSETVFDLLDTDGGRLTLPTVKKIVALKVIGSTLVVIGSNAVFSIRGDENGPFKATSYTVEYLSSIGATSHLSIVEVDGTLMWINYDGLYALQSDQIGVSFVVENVSKQTIQSVLDAIPQENKDYIKGAYNKREQTIRWVYSDLPSLETYRYNRLLDLNAASKAFYTHSINADDYLISGILSVSGLGSEILEENVTVSGNTVTVNSTPVFVTTPTFTPNQEVFKFLVTEPTLQNDMTYGGLTDTDHVDWASSGSPKSFSSYGVSGYRIRGELLRPFQTTPVVFTCKNIAGGGLTIKGIWDYGERVSMPQEVYRMVPTLPTYFTKRLKIRGKGRSMQIRFESVGNKPFELVGWSTFDTGGSAP